MQKALDQALNYITKGNTGNTNNINFISRLEINEQDPVVEIYIELEL